MGADRPLVHCLGVPRLLAPVPRAQDPTRRLLAALLRPSASLRLCVDLALPLGTDRALVPNRRCAHGRRRAARIDGRVHRGGDDRLLGRCLIRPHARLVPSHQSSHGCGEASSERLPCLVLLGRAKLLLAAVTRASCAMYSIRQGLHSGPAGFSPCILLHRGDPHVHRLYARVAVSVLKGECLCLGLLAAV